MKPLAELTDTEFLEWGLRDRGQATTMEIIAASITLRRCGMTPHSRAADLRRKLLAEGLTVECERRGSAANGRPIYVYRLVSLIGDARIEAGGQVALMV